MVSYSDYRFGVERQPLARPFHFKGGFFTEKWINIAQLERRRAGSYSSGSGSGGPALSRVTAVGGNAVLWSDPAVASGWSEAGGNALMSLLAERAVQLAMNRDFEDPIQALTAVRDQVHEEGRRITGREELSSTFTLNAMVALDFALWKLYAAGAGTERFVDLLRPEHRRAFSSPCESLIRVPLISYNVPTSEVVDLVQKGHHVLKIKLGQAGNSREMLAKDQRRLKQIHGALQAVEGPVHYYLDANGRYPDLGSMKRLLEFVDDIGALSRVVILEEPFPYEARIPVTGLPVRVAADESLHDVEDLLERVDLGYRALALKPAGKTLSLSVLMADRAAEYDIPCFVADSACVPSLLQWNLAFAGHLPPFPGVGAGLIESNGAQNYANWEKLVHEHSDAARHWLTSAGGRFSTGPELRDTFAGVFSDTDHYGGETISSEIPGTPVPSQAAEGRLPPSG